MAKKFSATDWKKIRKELKKDPISYGLPERSYGSVIFGSFNIRKLGKLGSVDGRDDHTMRFLADVCRRFDLLAVQEVMPELTGVRRLKELMGPEYGLIVSDMVGTFPGERGNEERLAFIYNRRLVQRSELVTEVSTSRTKVIKTIARYHKELFDKLESSKSAQSLRRYYEERLPKYHEDLAAGKKVKRPREPKFSVAIDPFLQFIRTPFAVAFEIRAHPGLEHHQVLCVNAHLQFGRSKDRKAEAAALFEWIVGKVLSRECPNIVLLGDLNFDLDNPKKDIVRIINKFDQILGTGEKAEKFFVSFPFMFPHPKPLARQSGGIFRTNIIHSQTYDHIGVFSPDPRVGTILETTKSGHGPHTRWGESDSPNYGVFDFSNLFSMALNRKPLPDLTRVKRDAFVNRFQHKVSDHMPIWYRIPLPTASQGFPSEV